MKKFLVLSIVFALSIPCFPVAVGDYDGLDNLIARSDAVAVISINEPSPTRSDNDGWKEYTCNVQQVLKGKIAFKRMVFKGRAPSKNAPLDTRVKMRLVDTTFSFRETFRPGSSHIVFLHKYPKNTEGIAFYSVTWEGSNIEVSPFGNEKMPQGKTVKEKIRTLIKTYIAYREQERKREDALLQKLLKQ